MKKTVDKISILIYSNLGKIITLESIENLEKTIEHMLNERLNNLGVKYSIQVSSILKSSTSIP